MDVLKRKRARLACKPCRERKRKCDGKEPCDTCTQWGYECYYEASRKRQSIAPSPHLSSLEQPAVTHGNDIALPSGPQATASPTPSRVAVDADHVRRVEANSGAIFVRKLAMKMDASKAPNLSLFGWNVGARNVPGYHTRNADPLRIVDVTSLDHMRSLSRVYFEKVHPCYGFLDQAQYFARLDLRYAPDSGRVEKGKEIYDGVLAGVAALGCLFSQSNATMTEIHLVQTARAALDAFLLSGPPPVELLIASTLRVVYLRMTGSAYETWIASSNLMHLIEASGLYPETPSLMLPNSQAHCDDELQKRIVGVAHHLNAWTSFDLGLSRVSYEGAALPTLPAAKAGDYTTELLALLPVSMSLDPGDRSYKETQTHLMTALLNVLQSTHTRDPSVMAQCNVVLCILRRIATHAQGLQDLSASPLASPVLDLLKRGLSCARDMIRGWHPWHQVVNVPFQTLCVLLVMDTRSSLALLQDAVQTLGLGHSTINSESTREAYKAAGLLMLLHHERRKEDLAVYGNALAVHQRQLHQDRTTETADSSPVADVPGTQDLSWMEALVQDIPNLQDMDLEQFLSADLEAI